MPAIDEVLQTGTRTTFTTHDGRRLPRAAIEAALCVEGLQLLELTIEERSREFDEWVADTNGLGCSERAREIRTVLMRFPGVRDAFVERWRIVLHAQPDSIVTVAALAAELGDYDVGIRHLAKR